MGDDIRVAPYDTFHLFFNLFCNILLYLLFRNDTKMGKGIVGGDARRPIAQGEQGGCIDGWADEALRSLVRSFVRVGFGGSYCSRVV